MYWTSLTQQQYNTPNLRSIPQTGTILHTQTRPNAQSARSGTSGSGISRTCCLDLVHKRSKQIDLDQALVARCSIHISVIRYDADNYYHSH
ncbi:hypothetical protein DBV39_16230 [Orrella marina]|uniref:Uncharacterized protein n=1 Tax=Orrella marina TaxID=2163011 RepID=A0A2R4XMJ8_9BURK|nr:hypothetical protein DBV39_16230 [Orrella marina]